MTTPDRRLRALPLVAVVLMAAAGCSSDDEPHTLTLDVAGDPPITITYVVNGRSTTETPATLPWRKDIRLAKDGEDTWSLQLNQPSESGSRSAVAYVDGQVMTRSAGSGGGRSRLSGSVG